MRFVGKKHLNSNMYKKIRITEKNNEIVINTTPDERFAKIEKLKLSTPYITDVIGQLSEEEKVEEIVKYFLRNNVICELIQKSDSIVVGSTSGTQLVICLSKKFSNILNIIIEKYEIDRLKFLNQSDIKNVRIIQKHYDEYLHLISKISFYQEGFIKKRNDILAEDNIEKAIILCLLSGDDNKIAKFDEKFIDSYLKKFIDETSNYIDVVEDNYNFIFYISDGDKLIYLSKELLKKYKGYIYNHNQYIINESKKQLSLTLEKERIIWKS